MFQLSVTPGVPGCENTLEIRDRNLKTGGTPGMRGPGHAERSIDEAVLNVNQSVHQQAVSPHGWCQSLHGTTSGADS